MTGSSTSTVLVVDGNTRLAHILAQLLDDEGGFRVQEVCHTAKAALQAAGRGRPDLVLLSARLAAPPYGELCRDLRVAAPEARVLLWVTSADDPAQVAAADGVLERGMTFREVVVALRRALAGLPVLPQVPPPVAPAPPAWVAPAAADALDEDDALVLACESCGVRLAIPTVDMAAAVEQGRAFFARHDACRTSIALPEPAATSSTRP